MFNQPDSQSDPFSDSQHRPLPLSHFPATRYQGSKRRLLAPLAEIFSRYRPGRALDLYSGTATVALLLRLLGWRVVANDFLLYNNATARVLLTGPVADLSLDRVKQDLHHMLHEAPLWSDALVSKNFASIYFYDDENLQIDRFCQSVMLLPDPLRDFYIYSVGQALLMKRPYNLFHRANLSMRTRDVARSFGNAVTWSKPILGHASKIAQRLLQFPFDTNNTGHLVTSFNTLNLDPLPTEIDLVYLDPPYLNEAGLSVDYCHFYHFLDGLCDYRSFGECNTKYPHRPIALKPSAWASGNSAIEEIGRILMKWPNATMILSYRSDGVPSFENISEVFRQYRRHFQLFDAFDYKYALSNKNGTKEMFLISSAD